MNLGSWGEGGVAGPPCRALGPSKLSRALSLPSFLVFLRYQCYYEYPLLTYLEYPILIAQGKGPLGPLHPLCPLDPSPLLPHSVLPVFAFQMSSSCCVSSISMGT